MKNKILIDHLAVKVKTTNAPTSSRVPGKCIHFIVDRRKSKKRLQMLHPHNWEEVANLRFSHIFKLMPSRNFLKRWGLYGP